MVAAAAFLIILVILFGLENVRNFVFGTFGIAAWIVLGVLGLGALIMLENWLEEERQKEKKAKAARKLEKDAKKTAEKAKMALLKKTNPKEYRRIIRSNVLEYCALLAFPVIFTILIILLIITSKK